eukprot:CAMPEP_0181104990 /NCGR_PEP_ID=MMETSP1071-20121207/15726_1 /TAXON_ID=35127 /ORGANISM="Thalassiosira sp., Strain NH16" /LENGTH=232 /DNA_ID=CAMNT_0023188233 /DNA_START=29 /DNA_END=727 /DNA_ORIENTATION=+
MKLYLVYLNALLAMSASATIVGAFTAGASPGAVVRQQCQRSASPRRAVYGSVSLSPIVPAASSSSSTTTTTTTLLRMSSSDFDFPSAMPSKPEQTMKEKMEESATQFIADLTARLGDGVDPPPELEALREARDGGDSDENVLAVRIYELMIEQGMTYDIDPDTGRLTPTQFDIKENLDIPEVKKEFKHLYSYGMELIKRGLIDLDACKDIVEKRLIERTGLSPEEFDKWLGY